MKKKISLTTLLLWIAVAGIACPVCEKNQPKVLRGITHGTGPQSNWDYVIIWSVVIIVAFTLFFSVKWLVRPGEQAENHIKRSIFKQ